MTSIDSMVLIERLDLGFQNWSPANVPGLLSYPHYVVSFTFLEKCSQMSIYDVAHEFASLYGYSVGNERISFLSANDYSHDELPLIKDGEEVFFIHCPTLNISDLESAPLYFAINAAQPLWVQVLEEITQYASKAKKAEVYSHRIISNSFEGPKNFLLPI
jgi:hypothetical protein